MNAVGQPVSHVVGLVRLRPKAKGGRAMGAPPASVRATIMYRSACPCLTALMQATSSRLRRGVPRGSSSGNEQRMGGSPLPERE